MKKKKCSYDNQECFNLMKVQEEAKKVKAKDVFEGYKDKSKPNKKKKTAPKSKKMSKY